MVARSVLPGGYSLITQVEAVDRLKARIDHYGSQAAYARHLGVSRKYVNNCVLGTCNIVGVVAADLGLKHVHAYQWTKNNEGTKQGDYAASRERHREIYPIIEAGAPGQVFPDRGQSFTPSSEVLQEQQEDTASLCTSQDQSSET